MGNLTLPEAQRIIDKTIGRPIRSASLYYSMYYLDEIAGVDNAAYDLSRLEDRLYDGFYWYGVGSILNEFGSFRTRFVIDGRAAGNVSDSKINSFIRSRIPEEYHSIIYKLYKNHRLTRSLKRVSEEFDIMGKERFMLNALKSVYKIDTGIDRSSAQNRELTGWADPFGGKSWAKLCDHILSRDDNLKRIWVDQSWAIEHNTGAWLDKVRLDYDEVRKVVSNLRDRDLVRYGINNETEVEISNSDSSDKIDYLASHANQTRIQKEYLPELLEYNFEGDMGGLFSVASWYNEEVAPDLIKYRRVLNL